MCCSKGALTAADAKSGCSEGLLGNNGSSDYFIILGFRGWSDTFSYACRCGEGSTHNKSHLEILAGIELCSHFLAAIKHGNACF